MLLSELSSSLVEIPDGRCRQKFAKRHEEEVGEGTSAKGEADPTNAVQGTVIMRQAPRRLAFQEESERFSARTSCLGVFVNDLERFAEPEKLAWRIRERPGEVCLFEKKRQCAQRLICIRPGKKLTS